MCTLGYGTCFFCQLVQLGRVLNRLAIEYRSHIRNLNLLIGRGNLIVSQVDPVPVISCRGLKIAFGASYDGLLKLANTPDCAKEFMLGAKHILSHDFSSFKKDVKADGIFVFFIAQLFSETARGHEDLVKLMLEKLMDIGKNLSQDSSIEISQTSKRRRLTRSSNKGKVSLFSYGDEISKIYTKFPYMQKGGAWPREFYPKGVRKVTTRNLFVYGVILRNLYFDIKQLCDRTNTFLNEQLGGFTLNLGDMGPLIRYKRDAYEYKSLLKANPKLTKNVLTGGMDMTIEDDLVLMLLAAICISERVRGYEGEVKQWVTTVRTGDGQSLPVSKFMKL